MYCKLIISLLLLVGALISSPVVMAEGEGKQETTKNPQENTIPPPVTQKHSDTLTVLQKFKDTFDYSLQKPVTPTHDFAGRVWLISYANGDDTYYANQNYLTQTAINKGFDFIMMYHKSNIDPDFYEANRKILEQPRGSGYWLWKPYFILKTLKMAAENDIVVYLDVGISIKANIIPLLEYLKTADRILVEGIHGHRNYIKRDAVVLSGGDNSLLDKRVLEGSIIIVKNTQNSRDFIRQWLIMCQNPRSLTDQPSELEEYPDFSHHLHDQSLLGLLYLQTPTGTHLISYQEEAQHYFDHHRRRPEVSDVSLFGTLKCPPTTLNRCDRPAE